MLAGRLLKLMALVSEHHILNSAKTSPHPPVCDKADALHIERAALREEQQLLHLLCPNVPQQLIIPQVPPDHLRNPYTCVSNLRTQIHVCPQQLVMSDFLSQCAAHLHLARLIVERSSEEECGNVVV